MYTGRIYRKEIQRLKFDYILNTISNSKKEKVEAFKKSNDHRPPKKLEINGISLFYEDGVKIGSP